MIKPAGIAILVALVPLHFFGVWYLLRLYREHMRFYRNANVVAGVVVGTRKYSSGEGPDYFARVFYTVAGTQYALKDGIWTHSRRYKKGQTVNIYYSPESPGSGRIASPSAPVIYILGALLIAAASVIVLTALFTELEH